MCLVQTDRDTVVLYTLGVPQGSVLEPLLYVLYTAELFDVVARHRLRVHMYADDSQVYVSAPANNAAAAVVRLTATLTTGRGPADCV